MSRGAIVVSASPEYQSAALDEIRDRVASAGRTELLGEGVSIVTVDVAFDKVAEELASTRPVFVRHVFPADEAVSLAADRGDLERIRDAVSGCVEQRLDTTRSFSVQARVIGQLPYGRNDIQLALQRMLTQRLGVVSDVRDPDQVVSVVVARRPDGRAVAYFGLSDASDNLSSWPGGMRRFAREPGQISRSEFKLLEAMEAFDIELRAGGVALDLGAAPGGWTRVLVERGLSVVAVDPAELHSSIASRPEVTHHRMRVQDLPRAGSLPRFDVVTNDMRIDARDSARSMRGIRRLLSPMGGTGVVTLKLPTRRAVSVMRSAIDLLERDYRVRGVRNLFHNRQEVTAVIEW